MIAGFLPSPRTLTGLTSLAVGGWKDMLTTLPPVEGDGAYLVLVWLLTLVAGTTGFLLARRVRSPWAGAVVPVGLLAVVIALGTFEGAFLTLVGLTFTLGVFAWLFVRYSRRTRIAGTGTGSVTRWVSAAALLAVAAASGWGSAS